MTANIYTVGTKVEDKDGRIGVVRNVTNHNGSVWYDVAFDAGEAVRFPADLMPAKDRSEPTWENQLWHARRLLVEKGWNALYNPHGMIGRDCKCGSCFCCAAYKVARDDERNRQIVADRMR